jgi:YHS domain-containing protein
MKMKMILVALSLAVSAPFAAADTSLVLKPTPEQIKAAVAVGNKECPVSGDKIGEMGPGKVVVYKGKAITLCCGSCVKKFGKDPAKFLAAAEASSKSASPAKMEMAPGEKMKGM